MGRTAPSYRQTVEELSRELKDFRNGLRGKDREAFDELIETARTYSDAGHNAGFLDPTQAALLSMLVGIERRLEDLENSEEGESS